MSWLNPDNLLHRLDTFVLLLSFVATFITTWALSRMSRVTKLGHDKSQGVQKFHVRPTSRLGGVALAIGLVVSYLASEFQKGNLVNLEFQNYSFWFLLAAIPVWTAGLTEDLTHRVGPTMRLVMATLSAACLYSSLGVSVNRTDVLPVDLLLTMPGATLGITLLVVAGFTHSVNIVDGFHGLASGLMVITLGSLSFISWKVGDALMFQMCLTCLFVLLGFFVFNWPKGEIFLGDAGAYLMGFWVVELGILLAMRNPHISPMAPVVAGLLPLIETLFSMYRRKFVKDYPVNHPDALHLHTLIYKRLIFNPKQNYSKEQKNLLNSRVIWFFAMPAVVFSTASYIFLESTRMQLIFIFVYLLMYIWLYQRLVRFKSPFFMLLR